MYCGGVDTRTYFGDAGDAIDLQLRNVSTSTEGNNEQQLPAVAVRGGSASKRNRAASQDVAATVGPNGQRLLVPTASKLLCRHPKITWKGGTRDSSSKAKGTCFNILVSMFVFSWQLSLQVASAIWGGRTACLMSAVGCR
jgi:hypothetical protein